MQPALSFEPVRYRLCWAREVAPGQTESDLGLEITPEQLLPALAGVRPRDKAITGQALLTSYGLQDAFRSYEIFSMLPIWCVRRLSVMFGEINSPEQLAAARRNLESLIALTETVARTAPYAGPVEVHLPYFDYDAWSRRFELLPQIRFGYHCGRMLPANAAANCVANTAYQLLLAASTTYGSQQMFTIAGWDRAVPGGACASWHAIPPERHKRYLSVMGGLTTALQRAMRRYLGSCCIRWDMQTLADPSRSWPLLAYVYSSPFPARKPRQFVRDLRRTGWIFDLASTARAPLRAALKRFQNYFYENGPRDLFRFYSRVRAKQVLDWACKERTTLTEIVSVEAQATKRFLQWANLVAHSTSPSEVETACSSLAAELDSIVRRIPGAGGAPQLPSLLLTEGTCGLNWAMGGRQKMSRLVISKQQFDGTGDIADTEEIQLPGDDYCEPLPTGDPCA